MACQVLVGKGQFTKQLVTHWTLEHHILFLLFLIFPAQPPQVLHAFLIPVVEIDVTPEGAGGAVGFLTQATDVPAGVVGFQMVPIMGLNSCPEVTLVAGIEVLGVVTVVGVQPADVGRGKVTVWTCEGLFGHVFGTVPSAGGKSAEEQFAFATREHGGGIPLFRHFSFRVNLVYNFIHKAEVSLCNPFVEALLLVRVGEEWQGWDVLEP